MDKDKNYKNLIRIINLLSELNFNFKKKFNEPDFVNEIKLVIDNGYDLNYAMPSDCRVKHWRGNTALHILVDKSVNQHFDQTFDLLLSYGSDIVCQNNDGYSVLCLFFERFKDCKYNLHEDFWERVNQLLSIQIKSENTSNPCSKDGVSHLHLACMSGNLKAVEFFLKAGAPVNQAISNDYKILPGYTPLHIALRNKDGEIVQLLMQYDADLKCLNGDEMSPLQLICYEDLRKYLCCSRRFDFEEEKYEKQYILYVLSQPYKADSIIKRKIGLNRLHELTISKYSGKRYEELEKLLNEANVNSHINFDSPLWPGSTVLHFAAQNHLQMLMLLLSNGANLLAKDANGITPLDLCCQTFEPSVIRSILLTQPKFRSIAFQNGDNLTDFIAALESEDKLRIYLKFLKTVNNVNNFVPFDSPLWPGFSLLHLAVMISNRSKVKLCLEYGADFTKQDANKTTALHLAFHLNKIECIYDILKAHSTTLVNPVDNNNLSHFHIACIVDQTGMVYKFLRNGVDPNIPTSIPYFVKNLSSENIKIAAGSTAFHIAVAMNHEDLISYLVEESKADPNLCDAEGFTWVHRLSLEPKTTLYRYDIYTDIKIYRKHPRALTANPVGPGGLSHLHIACLAHDLIAVKALLPLASNINEPLSSELRKFCKYDDSTNLDDFDLMIMQKSTDLGDTPLHLLAKVSECSIKVTDAFLKHGADVMAKNSEGHNPVYVFCNDKLCEKVPKALSNLIRAVNNKSEDGLTRLHFSCALKDMSLITEFLDNGEDFNSIISVDSRMWPGESPLSLLLNNKTDHPMEHDIAKLLLECFLERLKNPNEEKKRKQSSSNSQDLVINVDRVTAFHVSCMGSDPDIVERFILCGVDVNAQVDSLTFPVPNKMIKISKAGYTAMHYATENGSESVLEMLLKHGADISIEDVKGRTPVHLAAEKCFDKVKIFSRYRKIDASMKSTSGQTIMDSLCKNVNMQAQDCLDLLKLGFSSNVDFSIKLFSYLRAWARKMSLEEFNKAIAALPDDILSKVLKNKDSSGCNVIHHIVSTKLYLDSKCSQEHLFIYKFAKNIAVLSNKGCDIDHQDNNGLTPLHYAVMSKQPGAVEALLKTGADINVVDKCGMTPFAYCYEKDHWSDYDKIGFWDRPICDKIVTSFFRYIAALQTAGLYLGKLEKDFYQRNREHIKSEIFSVKLERMGKKEIYASFSVRNLLNESLITKFPVMPCNKRQEILKYLESNDCFQFDDMLSEMSPFLKLQHNKILKSVKLFQPVRDSLRALLDSRLPDHCLESILTKLNIYDWSNLLRAAKQLHA